MRDTDSNIITYAMKVEAMREAQKEYFKNAAIAAKKKTTEAFNEKKNSLILAKALEKEVDSLTDRFLNK